MNFGKLVIYYAMLFVSLLLVTMAQVQKVETVIPAYCISKIEMKEKGECSGPDIKHMDCKGVLVTYKKGCEQLRIVKEKK